MTLSETDLLAKVPNQLFIGGDWVDSTSGRTIEVRDPELADAVPSDKVKT